MSQTKAFLNCFVLWFVLVFMTYNFTQKYVNCEGIDTTELYEEDGEKEKKSNEKTEQDYLYLNFFDYFVGVEESGPIDRYLHKKYDSESDITTPPPELLS